MGKGSGGPRTDPSGACAASDTYSWESSTIIDTCSEPPRCDDKLAEKILRRASTGKKQFVYSGDSMASRTVSSRSATSTTSSRSTAYKSVMSKSGSSGSSSRVLMKDGATADQSSKKSACSQDATSTSSRSSRSVASKSSERHNTGQSSRSSSRRKGSSAQYSRTCSSSASRRGGSSKRSGVKDKSRDSENNSLAIVPLNSTVDPPSYSSSPGSIGSEQSEVLNEQLSASRGQELAVWEEREDSDRSGSSDESEDSNELEDDEIDKQHHQLHTIESASESESGSESEYSSGSRTSKSTEENGELIATDNNAITLRESDGMIISTNEDDMVDTRALVKVDNSGHHEQAIVPAPGRYLAAAVDNNYAIVPFNSTVYEAYDHTYVTCPENLRFRFLYTFLKKNMDKKIIIFFSTTKSARFHSKLLNHFHIPALTIHGRQKRDRFISTFFRFSDLDEGILCATDAAGRDLDVPPSVDWVLQFEPPDDPSEYILRVARISCDSDRVGRSLLFLNPGEQGFLKYYHSAGIPVSEFEIPKLADIQATIEYHVNESDSFLRYARDAYGSYLISYASHGFRDVYNVHDLNKNDVASAFGLLSLPSSSARYDDDSSHSSRANSAPKASTRTWQSTKKPKTKSWMREERTWPHCAIKVHPRFKHGARYDDDDE